MVRRIFYEGELWSVLEVRFDSVLFSDDSGAASDDCCTLAR